MPSIAPATSANPRTRTLRDEGLIVTTPGWGSFVAAGIPRRLDHGTTDVMVVSTPTSSYQRIVTGPACELVGLVDQLLGPLE
jgi:hypothetical protein